MKLKKLFALALCLVSVIGLLTVSAGATVVKNDLHLTKSAEYNSDTGMVDVTLTAYASGVMSTQTKPKPTDFVLVLDVSNSMKNNYTEDALPLSALETSRPSGYYCASYVSTGLLGVKTYSYFHVKYDGGWYIMLDGSDAGWQSALDTYVVGSGWNATEYEVTDFYVTRLGAMKDAACGFVDTVYNKATTDDTDHRIAIVSYAGSATTNVGLTQLYVPRADDATEEQIAAANQQAAANSAALKSAINNFSVAAAADGTQIHTGLDAANDIFTAANENRTQIAVTLTDGVPSYADDDNNSFDVGLANNAIAQANELKNKEVFMYAIGIFDGANPSQLYGDSWDYAFFPDVECTGLVGSYWGASGINSLIQAVWGNGFPEIDIPAGNRLLNYISDNYSSSEIGIVRSRYDPSDRGSAGNGYLIEKATAPGSNQKYYLTADNMAELNTAFTTITSTVTSSNVSLDKNAVLRDVVAANYYGTPTNITVQVADYNGSGFNAAETSTLTGSYDAATRTVSVTGFDYQAQMVTTDTSGNPKGQMLIVTYSLPISRDFLGGNGVPVSVYADSGVFAYSAQAGYALTENFIERTVNVPVKSITPDVQNQTIYLSGSVDASALYTANKYSWEDDYVSISYAVAEGTTEKTGEQLAPTTCTPYTVTCTVDGGGSNEASDTNEATVHVYTPVITGEEKTVYLSKEATLSASVDSWKACQCEDVTAPDENDEPHTPIFAYSGEGVSDGKVTPTVCGEYTVTLTEIGGLTLPEDVQVTDNFTVHVLKPTVTGTDAHIKMGAEAPMAAKYDWNTTCCDNTERSAEDAEPKVECVYNNDRVGNYPSTCAEYTVIAKIGDTTYSDIFDTFIIHVHAPTLSGKETTIYLGNSTTLNANDVTLGWVDTCVEHTETAELTGNPTPDYTISGVDQNDEVTPTACRTYGVTLSKIGEVTPNEAAYTTTITVHVQIPEIKGDDVTIYLGKEATLNADVSDWDACEHSSAPDVTGSAPGAKFSFSGGATVSPTQCTDYTATLTEIGEVLLENTNYTITDELTVHVLRPSITADDVTIYYGTSIDLDGVMQAHTWLECEHGKTTAIGDAPQPEYTYNVKNDENKDAYSPDKCENLTATWTLAGIDFTDGFTVHVAMPEFTTSDITIYRGNSTTLEERIKTEDTWECEHTFVPSAEDGKPAVSYAFKDGEDAIPTVQGVTSYAPTVCKTVTITPTVGNKTWADLTVIVHVLQPTFDVVTRDIWADYGTSVDLTTHGIASCTLVWQDTTSDHAEPAELPENAPEVSRKTFSFDKSDSGSYTVGTADEAVSVPKLSFTLSNDYAAEFTLSSKTFTIHVNKFDLTIGKTWDGAAVYKQDVIFTVSGGLGNFQVVLPAGQKSITITGLLCGQKYTVSEDTAWTWRWTSDGEKPVAKNETAHGVSNSDPHAEMQDKVHSVDVSFANTLVKQLWLDFCTFVSNIFGKGGNS